MKELEQKRYNWVGGKVKNPFSEENIKIDKPLARSIKKMKEKMQINVSYYKGYEDGRPRAVKNNRRALLPPPLPRPARRRSRRARPRPPGDQSRPERIDAPRTPLTK